MNSNDPKHTAFALGELTPAERAEIERELSTNPDLGAEVAEIREMAGILKKELAAEPAGALAEHQRWAIIRAATASGPPSANERDAVDPGWWQRAGVWQVVAACAVFGFGVYAIMQQFALPSKGGTASDGRKGDIAIVPTNVVVVPDPLETPQPELPSIGEQVSQRPTPIAQNPHTSNADLAIKHSDVNATVVSEAVNKIAKEVEAIKEGSSFAEFREKFIPVPNTNNTYSLRELPVLRVDVEFAGSDGKILAYPPPDNTPIKRISKPYLSTK